MTSFLLENADDPGFLEIRSSNAGWCPPVMWMLIYKPHEYYSYIYHKP